MGQPVEVVLFDLGGVLIEFSGLPTMLSLTGMTEPTEFWRRWLACPWVRRFESGQCTAEEFATGLVAEWRLPLRPSEFLETFVHWPVGPFPGAEQLVRRTKDAATVGCLSNTNELHWHERVASWSLLDEFDHQFPSFEIGLLKPDLAVFEHVVQALGVAPEQILLLDDNLPNVEGAAASGLQAIRVVGIEQAQEALTQVGVLQP